MRDSIASSEKGTSERTCFFMLAGALSDYAYKTGYSAAVISGTVREEKLYRQMGFESFAAPVGTDDAQFIPMVLTRSQYEQSIGARLKQKSYSFLPGPVKLTEEIGKSLNEEPISHRSYDFSNSMSNVKQKLKLLSDAKFVSLLLGSGTLANEAMIAQISRYKNKGLIISNGAFGERLQKQAVRWRLDFDWMKLKWGEEIDIEQVKNQLSTLKFEWILMVHGETSTGMLNDIQTIQNLCKAYHVKLCLDCVSSFGTLPFSLSNVHLATAVSGKALGAPSGVAIVFSNNTIEEDESLPSYLDLGLYSNENIPFTFSSQLLKSLEQALNKYQNGTRYSQLQQRYNLLLDADKKGELSFLTTKGYPMIVTLKVDEAYANLADDAALSGFDLHFKSAYLAERNWIQLSIIQPDFEKAWSKFIKWFNNYKDYQNNT